MQADKIKIFVDFDGTISTVDIGKEIFYTFGNKNKVDEVISNLKNEIINSLQCWEQLIENSNKINENILIQIIDSAKIDESFHRFANFCYSNKIEIFILSDGFDIYIKRILQREGLSHIPFYANKLEIVDEKFVASFPYFNPDYPTTANPKMIHIINNSADDDYTIYIGNGSSDYLAAQYCDLIFAKNNLLKFCEINRIYYYPYKNFDDILNRIKMLLGKKRLKKSHQAMLKRKIAYEAE